jgi:hypothetical protein
MKISIIRDITLNGIPVLHCRTLQELERLSMDNILEKGVTIKNVSIRIRTRSSRKKYSPTSP